jgi:hypothetical protein
MKIGVASGDWVSPDQVDDGVERWGGSGWARVGQYLPLITGHTFHVGTLIFDPQHGAFQIRDADGAVHDVDAVWMQRLMHRGADLRIKLAQKEGQIIINDVDDWYWGLSETNQAFRATHPKTSPEININHYKATLCASDLLTVSTPYLYDRIKQLARGTKVILVPNYIDVSRFPKYKHVVSTKPTFGWAGSTGHRSRDLETLAGVITPFVNSEKITLHHHGAHPSMPTMASALRLKDDQVSTTPLTDHLNYPSGLNFDVGIVPLNDIPFNRAKSDIKGLEYSACGIPFIAQNLDSYTHLKSILGIGRTAKRPSDWIRHINALRSYDARVEEGEACYEGVKARDIKYGAQLHQQIFDQYGK